MGENSAQTVKEIEQVRDRLDGEIRELEERLPPVHVTKRIAAVAFTGTTGMVTLWAIKRMRNRRRKKKEPESMRAVVQVLPDGIGRQVSDMLEDGTWKRPAAYAAGAWALIKFTEVRQLRRMNRMLASRA